MLDCDTLYLQYGKLTFTDIAEPHVTEGAGALAVDALKLVGTNDDVAQRGAVVEDEDGAVTAGVSVGVAGTATVILAVAHVDGARDGARRREGDDGADSGRDVESLGGGGGGQSRDGEDLLEEHGGMVWLVF